MYEKATWWNSTRKGRRAFAEARPKIGQNILETSNELTFAGES